MAASQRTPRYSSDGDSSASERTADRRRPPAPRARRPATRRRCRAGRRGRPDALEPVEAPPGRPAASAAQGAAGACRRRHGRAGRCASTPNPETLKRLAQSDPTRRGCGSSMGTSSTAGAVRRRRMPDGRQAPCRPTRGAQRSRRPRAATASRRRPCERRRPGQERASHAALRAGRRGTRARVRSSPTNSAWLIERVADRHLGEVRQRAEQDEVVEVEVVAGVDAEAERVRARRLARSDRNDGGRGLAAARTPGRTARCRARPDRRPLGGPADRASSASTNRLTRTPRAFRSSTTARKRRAA